MNNKLTLEEQFLTLEQAKELQALGIDFSGANFGIYNFYESLNDDEVTEIRPIDKIINDKLVTPTLSVAEMINILPPKITYKGNDLYLSIAYNTNNKIILKYDFGNSEYDFVFVGDSFRDSLFEMIKQLKINKLI